VTAQDSECILRPLTGGAINAAAPTTQSDEAELVLLLQKRSVPAWEMLFERYFDRIYRYALARMRSCEAAEDVAAATFHRALATIDNYSYRGRPTLAWLYGIARNVVKETRRRETRHQPTGFLERLVRRSNGHRASDALPFVHFDGAEALVAHMDLESAMGQLTKVQREVVILRYFAGLSATETGHVIGRPETAVYSLQARALAALRRQLV
jgi:RNA polymerase sigma-70 factor (ECF subfamily)